MLKACRITKITGSAVSLGAGGFLSVLGLVLAPFTLGASAALTVAGAGVIAAGSAATGLSAGIVKLVKGKAQLEEAQKCINLDQQLSYHVNIALEEYNKVARNKVKEDIDNNIERVSATVKVLDRAVEGAGIAMGHGAGHEAIGIRVGGLVSEIDLVGRFSVVETGREVRPLVEQEVKRINEAGAVAAHVAISLAVAVPLDIYQIVDSSIALADTGGKSEKDPVFQYIMKKVESLIKGKHHD